MKWFLVVYFLSAGEWMTAEQLDAKEWYRTAYPDAETCIEEQNYFATKLYDPDFVRASCELLPWRMYTR